MMPVPFDSSQFTMTPYQRRHRSAIRDLLSRAEFSHTHLDWQETEAWLEDAQPPLRLGWMRGRLIGVLAASELIVSEPPAAGACWMRLAGVTDGYDPVQILSLLWQPLRAEMHDLGVRECDFLMIRQWTEDAARTMGFTPVEQIITLSRDDSRQPQAVEVEGLHLRPAYGDDLAALIAVDHEAFVPPWRMTPNDLKHAMNAASICKVATVEREIVGYQISTLYFDGAHLARLAVRPAWQGHHVGGALVSDMIRHFGRRGVYAMTVNTQGSNQLSQRLYRRFGFTHNGYDLPVWGISL